MTRDELARVFAEVIFDVRGVIKTIAYDRLVEVIHPQDTEVTVLDAIYQVVGHMQQHVGQVILLAKQMTGGDLHLVMPRVR